MPGLPHVSLGVRLLRTDEDVLCAKSFQSRPTLCDPRTVAQQVPLSMRILQTRILEWVALPSSRGSSDPGIKPAYLVSPALAGEFFTTEPLGKPKRG